MENPYAMTGKAENNQNTENTPKGPKKPVKWLILGLIICLLTATLYASFYPVFEK